MVRLSDIWIKVILQSTLDIMYVLQDRLSERTPLCSNESEIHISDITNAKLAYVQTYIPFRMILKRPKNLTSVITKKMLVLFSMVYFLLDVPCVIVHARLSSHRKQYGG